MKTTLRGLRVALDKCCLFLVAAMAVSGPLIMLASAQSNQEFYRANLVPIIIGSGIMAGALAAAYFVLAAVFWFITPADKNAPLPFGAEEWARAHTASEREAQLTREMITVIALGAVSTVAFFAALSVSETSESFTTLIAAFVFVPMLLCTELIRRNSARSTAHRRLIKAEKKRSA